MKDTAVGIAVCVGSMLLGIVFGALIASDAYRRDGAAGHSCFPNNTCRDEMSCYDLPAGPTCLKDPPPQLQYTP